MPPTITKREALRPGHWRAKSEAMALPLADDESAASEADKARRRHLNDQLRTKGRGGVATVSLSLAAAGEEAVTQVLRAIAAAQVPHDQDNSYGGVDTQFGWAMWRITVQGGLRVMSVWLRADVVYAS